MAGRRHPIDIMFPVEIETIIDWLIEDRIRHPHACVTVILRGVPGSGKSTFASFMKIWGESKGLEVEICSADDYLRTRGGYDFNVQDLQAAHDSCQSKFRHAIQRRVPVIVIDNSNVEPREWDYYDRMARGVLRICHVDFVCHSLEQAQDLADRRFSIIPNETIRR